MKRTTRVPAPDGHKRCSKCETVLPVSHFAKHSKRADGLQNYCKPCNAEAEKKRRQDPAKLARLRERDRERRTDPKRVEYMRAWKETNEGRLADYERRMYKLRNKFGITPEEVQAKLDEQNGQCAICLIDIELFKGKDGAALDHDHFNNEVRGLLCSRCNVGIGMLQDSPALMKRAADYIDFWAIVHEPVTKSRVE